MISPSSWKNPQGRTGGDFSRLMESDERVPSRCALGLWNMREGKEKKVARSTQEHLQNLQPTSGTEEIQKCLLAKEMSVNSLTESLGSQALEVSWSREVRSPKAGVESITGWFHSWKA